MTFGRLPNLFIAGAPKCGTTSLAYYLAQHEDIFVPAEKEPMYFGSDLTMNAARISRKDYEALYESWGHQKYGLDATPAYLVSEQAAREIRTQSPNSKVIICVRNPIDAVVSAYYHNRFRLSEDSPTLESALDLQEQRKLANTLPRFGTLQTLWYFDLYSYSTTIPRFIFEFGNDNVIVVLLDDLSKRAIEVLAQVSVWLKIDETCVSRFSYKVQNSGATPRFELLSRFAIHPPAWAGKMTSPILSKSSRLRVRSLLRRINSSRHPAPALHPETRARLAREFAGDVEWLSRYLDRDLTHWLVPDAAS